MTRSRLPFPAAQTNPLRGAALGLCVVLACFFWRLGLSAQTELQRMSYITFYLDGALPTAASYEDMLRTESRSGTNAPFALWTQLERQQIKTLETGRSTQVAVIPVVGDMRLALVAAFHLDEEDTRGCLIDRAAANDLFGSGDPTGNTLRYNDREYTVRGVIDRPNFTLVIRPEAGDKTPLTAATVGAGNDGESFAIRHGLEEGYRVTSAAFASAAGLMSSMPVAVLLLLLLELLFGLYRRHRHYPVREFLLAGSLLAGCTCCFLLLLTSLPASLVPSRWSDFSFWYTAFTGLKEQFLLLLAVPKYRQDLLLLGICARATWGLPAALILWKGRGWLRRDRMIQLLCSSTISGS